MPDPKIHPLVELFKRCELVHDHDDNKLDFVRINSRSLQVRNGLVTGTKLSWDVTYKNVLGSTPLEIICQFHSKFCNSLLQIAKVTDDAKDTIGVIALDDLTDFELEYSTLIDLLRVASGNRSLYSCTNVDCDTSFPARKCACGRYHCTPRCAQTDCDLVWCREGECLNSTTQIRTVGCTCFSRLCGHKDDTAQTGEPCVFGDPDYESRHCNCHERICSDCRVPMKPSSSTCPKDAQTKRRDQEEFHREVLASLELQLDFETKQCKIQQANSNEVASLKQQLGHEEKRNRELQAEVEVVASLKQQLGHEEKRNRELQAKLKALELIEARMESWYDNNIIKGSSAILAEARRLQASNPTTTTEIIQARIPGRKREHSGSSGKAHKSDAHKPPKFSRITTVECNSTSMLRHTTAANAQQPAVSVRDTDLSREDEGTDALVTDQNTFGGFPASGVGVGTSRKPHVEVHTRIPQNGCLGQNGADQRLLSDEEIDSKKKKHLRLWCAHGQTPVAKLQPILDIIYDPKYWFSARCSGVASLPYGKGKKILFAHFHENMHKDEDVLKLSVNCVGSAEFRAALFRITHRWLMHRDETKYTNERASELAGCLHALYCKGPNDNTTHDHKAWNKEGMAVRRMLVNTRSIIECIRKGLKSDTSPEKQYKLEVDTLGLLGEYVLPSIVDSVPRKDRPLKEQNVQNYFKDFKEHYEDCQDNLHKIGEAIGHVPDKEKILNEWWKTKDPTTIREFAGVDPDPTALMKVVLSFTRMDVEGDVTVKLFRALMFPESQDTTQDETNRKATRNRNTTAENRNSAAASFYLDAFEELEDEVADEKKDRTYCPKVDR